MIIVSQDKNIIYNYDKIECIFAVPDFEDFGKKIKWEIKAHLDSGKCYRLGVYKAEERAKEVLREIIEFLDRKSLVEMDRDDITMQVLGNIYRMPKE